eukprot:SAG31_NODE_5201_length_2680_cov_3.606742_2_plen_84_part_00
MACDVISLMWVVPMGLYPFVSQPVPHAHDQLEAQGVAGPPAGRGLNPAAPSTCTKFSGRLRFRLFIKKILLEPITGSTCYLSE